MRAPRVLVLALQATVVCVLCSCWLASGAVDEYMSCDRFLEGSSKRAARLLDHIPCDMTKKSYCEFKGTVYPEAAIWRFKEENRALMRRLYGDLESPSVYREMRSVNLAAAAVHASDATSDIFATLQEYNIRLGSGFAMVQSAREPPSSSKQRKVVKRKRRPQSAGAETEAEVEAEEMTAVDAEAESELAAPVTTTTAASTTSEAVTATTAATTTATSTAAESDGEENYAAAAGLLSDETDWTSEDLSAATTPSSDGASDSETTTDSLATTGETDETETVTPSASSTSSSAAGESKEELIAAAFDVTTDGTLQKMEDIAKVKVGSGKNKEQEQHKAEAVESKEQSQSVSSPDGFVELADDDLEEYEDAVDAQQKEALMPPLDYTGPSINACPVKEEVFAPYWANNTRDQVLALLNLYPFEQYIHMETCKYENEEMLCRRGCRCEQQYRLHRLLAFDPSNECRGIFSDWFRFPSYCICKCYNVAEDMIPTPKPKPKPVSESEPAASRENAPREEKSSSAPQNIPAVLPYEATQALLMDMAERTDRDLGENQSHMVRSNAVEEAGDDDAKSPRRFFYAAGNGVQVSPVPVLEAAVAQPAVASTAEPAAPLNRAPRR